MDMEINETFAILQEPLEEFNDGYSDNTRLSLESQDFDSNQGTLSSESVEPIHENFQDMGIDNWHDASDQFSPTLAHDVGDVPTVLDSCNDLPCMDSEMVDTPLEPSVSNNMQLMLYVPPSDNAQQAKENQAFPGSCGLGNIGNTCYMNAGLQCLTATKPLVQFFVSNWAEQTYVSSSPASYLTINDNTGVLTHSFAQLITKMWSGKFRVISPSDFKRNLGQRHIQFKDSRQHDCQEFLALLLDTLHEQLNMAGKCSAIVPFQGLPDKSCKEDKEEAVAGCSRQKSVQPLREEQPSARQPSGRSSNIDLAKQLAERHADQVEKNHLEQTRQTSQSPAAVASSALPATAMSLSSPLCSLGDTRPSLLKNIAIQDYFKEAKTSNVNVLSPLQRSECRPNNQIKFDSEKFGSSRLSLGGTAAAVSPRGIRSLGPRDPVLVENPNNLNEECSEKSDESSSLLHEPLHKKLKQTNLEQRQPCSSATNSTGLGSVEESLDYGEIEQGSTYKKLKLAASHIKNKEEDDEDGGIEMESISEQREDEEDEIDLAQQEASAQAHWDQHLVTNQSVIVDTFQGQFRSTVVCSMCHHRSVTFEPFMYLSVPLPHAMELQLEVTYVPANPDLPALRFLVNMHRMATAEQLREEVRRLAAAEPDSDLAVCESMEHRVSKVLHPHDLIEKSPRDRVFYVIEVPKLDWLKAEQMRRDEPPDLVKEMSEDCIFIGPMTHETFLKVYPSSNVTPPPPSLRHQDEESLPWPKCNICLEEVEISNKPLKHGEDCECVLCASCLQECKTHQAKSESTLKCPVCHLEVDPDVDFVVMTTINSNCKPSKWMLTVPVVFRVDEEGAEYNNLRTSKLYGHPRLLHLPSKIIGSQLYECLQPYAPSEDFTLLQVGGNGLLCSHCLFNSHCKGCAISSSPLVEIELQPNSMLAVRTSRLPEEPLPITMGHKSLQKQRKRKEDKLSLYDCLDAFTKPETLDSENPWFCPNCKQNQCATKTISVWRYPPVVIIYLKRFVFHEGRSIKLDNKVAFPLKGLHLKESAFGNKHTSSLYDLYSCVCHIGGTTGSGHYMAYTRHPLSQEWYRYNDSSVLRQRPEIEDHNQAYVLFYQRCDLDTAPAVL